MKSLFSALTLALALVFAVPALANGNHESNSHGNNQSGEFSAFGAFAGFATQGATAAGAVGSWTPATAESFSDHAAGVRISRCGTCNGLEASGFSNNASGALANGPGAWATGAGSGFASGFAAHLGAGFSLRNGRR